MRAARLALAALLAAASAASALPPDWDRELVSPVCPYCDATLSWRAGRCYTCQGRIEWALPEAPKSGEEAWRFVVAAVTQRDDDFTATLVEGDAAESRRALSLAPLLRFASSSPVEGGERVVVLAADRETSLVLTWTKGKFGRAWQGHKPLRNQGEALKALKAAAAAERRIRDADLDGNGTADYWTGDWSGLARLADAEGKPLALVPPEAAAADLRPLPASPDGAARPRLLAAAPAAPWNGYRFAALEPPEPGGFAFIAVPAEHGVTGWLTLVVSDDGRAWGKDCGAAEGATAPAADEAAKIAEAIRALDADDPAARDAAEGALRALGRRAKPSMTAALESASPEARRRLRFLLDDAEDASPDLRHWPGGSKDLLDAGWQGL